MQPLSAPPIFIHLLPYSLLELLLDSVLAILLEEHSLWVLRLALQVLLHILLVMIEHYFIVDQVLVVFLLQRVNFEVEVEGTHWFASWLVIREVQLAHVGVSQGLVNSDSLQGVKC